MTIQSLLDLLHTFHAHPLTPTNVRGVRVEGGSIVVTVTRQPMSADENMRATIDRLNRSLQDEMEAHAETAQRLEELRNTKP